MRPAASLLLGLASQVVAFTFPPNQVNGVYKAYYDANGTEVHELLGTTPIPSRRDADLEAYAQLAARQSVNDYSQSLYCGCGFNMDHGNCDAAVANLKGQLGNGVVIQMRVAYYAIANNAVAFACNPSQFNTFPLNVGMVSDAAGRITNACGWYVAGTDFLWEFLAFGETPDELTLEVGYMQYSTGLDFCGNSITSSANHC